jgi:hypothetical protein
MVNPFTYTNFFITKEPEDDTDRDPVAALAWVEVPFGQ